MDSKKPLAGISVLVAGTLFAGGAVAAGGGVWYLQHRATIAAQQRADEAEQANEVLDGRIAELEARLASATAELEKRSTDAPSEEQATPPGADESSTPAKDTKEIGYVLGVQRDGGKTSLVADYAEMLTGDDAVEAHEADGLGSLDGEQFYIRNVNSKKRTLPIAEGAKVVVWSWFADTEDIGAKEIPLAEFTESMPGGAKADRMRSSLPYWFTLRDGEIVRIEEQFIP